MEINFQKQLQTEAIPIDKVTKFKGTKRSKSCTNKFVGVRQRPSGKWVAEIKDTTQKIRMWLGTYDCAEDAASAYDQAAVLLRGSNTRTNFVTRVYENSHLASRIKNLLNSKKIAKHTDSTSSNSVQSTTTSVASLNVDNCSSPISSDDSNSSENMQRSNIYEHSGVDELGGNETVLSFDQESQLFHNTYKPDSDLGTSPSSAMSGSSFTSWGFQEGFEIGEGLLDFPKDVVSAEMEFTEFEIMKVERQISASLYAVNGVQEYIETIIDPYESLWDQTISNSW